MENQNNLEHLPDHLKRLAMFTTILEACHKSTVCSKLLNKLYNETLTQSKKEGYYLGNSWRDYLTRHPSCFCSHFIANTVLEISWWRITVMDWLQAHGAAR